MKYPALISLYSLLLFIAAACGGKSATSDSRDDASPDSSGVVAADSVMMSLELPDDTLRAVTLYGPTSYFIYRGQPMGYDYTLVSELAKDCGLVLDLKVANSLSAAVAMLDSGKVDLIAYDVPITNYYKQFALPCGPETYTTQMLVQNKVKGRAPVSDVTELVGKEVYVIDDSKYQRRLENLNEELAGGIDIRTVSGDSATAEDLIAEVYSGNIPMTVVDSDIARLNGTYYHGLDISTPVSMPQRASWAVAPGKDDLAESINEWFAQETPRTTSDELLKRYFEMSKTEPYKAFDFSKGYISKYDNIFKKYADAAGWDWRMLAAQSYVESRFNPGAMSWVGARGIMQIMPSTARGYGYKVGQLSNPETSVRIAARLNKDIDRYLIDLVPNDNERIKFAIAAYNCGIAHIYDAIALAKKYGLDPQKWDGNVEKALLMKSNPRYYNDPVVKYGYARGSETSAYVKQIMRFYQNAVREIPA